MPDARHATAVAAPGAGHDTDCASPAALRESGGHDPAPPAVPQPLGDVAKGCA